ncbi:MAG TPA: hypothetical protein VFB29_08035 [Pseudolabrys sp.]|nr:hypothetical protein [Pseudolabrys sp.]
MTFDATRAQKLLEQFDFAAVFVDVLGWDRHSAAPTLDVSGRPYALSAIAEKRGMVAWLCEAPTGQSIPDRATRKKIEHQAAKTTLEHLIIFTDAKRAEQIWCWARRESGKPVSVLSTSGTPHPATRASCRSSRQSLSHWRRRKVSRWST